MVNGYRLIVWGVVFLIFHINLGEFYIIPNFVSYSLIYYGLKIVAKNYKSKTLSESARYCGILIIPSLFAEYFSLSDINIFMGKPVFHILWLSAFGLLKMISIYKFLKGNSEILESKENILGSDYRKRADIYVILASISLVISNLNVAFMVSEIWGVIAMFELFINIWTIRFSRRLGEILAD